MPADTSALHKAHKNHDDANATQQTPEIAFIHTPKGRILTSSDHNFLEFSELMNGIIKKRETLEFRNNYMIIIIQKGLRKWHY
jgi:hypothetical protein